MPELLVEVFSEEIPAGMQGRAADDLLRLLCDGLGEANLAFGATRAFSTPRRLAVAIDGLPERQADRTEERKGPKVGAPDQAVQGFLRAAGVDSLDDCEQRETPKGPVWFVVRSVAGQPSREVLPELIGSAIDGLNWPKSMRFAGYQRRWVRPLHSILAVFDGRPLEGALDLGGGTLAFSDETRGHRFLAPEPFAVTGFADYEAGLAERHVILDPARRRAMIAEQMQAAASGEGLAVKDDPALLDEVAGLVEWPHVLIGTIDEPFMEVPPEVLTTSMRSHQRYFALQTSDGALAPRFAMTANMPKGPRDRNIVDGNERVLRARLSDAKFFWDQDRRTPLADRVPALRDIVFHARLGTLDQKIDRIEALAVQISKRIPGADRDRIRSAARLCKADLVTGMVGEFPELQGVMGKHYALNDGESPEVARAIEEHYSPLGPNDMCPSDPVSVAVSLADKIDTLAGFWLIGETPTGSKDPFALRRAALGVIRLILENGIRMKLGKAVRTSARLYVETVAGLKETVMADASETGHAVEEEDGIRLPDLRSFFVDRLRVALRDKGTRHDLIQAVFALEGEDDLVRLLARVDALSDFLNTDDGANLLTAYKRAANILRIEEKRDSLSYADAPDKGIFVQPEEGRLYDALAAAQAHAGGSTEDEDFAAAMGALASLRGPVDAFFDDVTVNDDDDALRANRLKLLSRIRDVMTTVADFSQVEG